MVQVVLFVPACECGRPVLVGGRCGPCYARIKRDRLQFGGHREEVLARDGWKCRVCEGRELLIVHHRSKEQDPDYMITLCAGCHARVHRLMAMRYWMLPVLVELWIEQHPGVAVQVQLEMSDDY